MSPLIGLSLMPQHDFCAAIQPLFEENLVDVIEWSFDTGWGQSLPDWCSEVLTIYSECDRLFGHGVSYSLLSAHQDRELWLACLDAECNQYRYRHITEHLGWMVAEGFAQGAPLPLPLTPTTLAVGQDRLKQLAAIAQVPVGLENLAFAFHRQDVLSQGEFLGHLLAPIDGFIVLDIHNLYCQMHNFQLSAEEILNTYPLEKVREVHLSGGSWSGIGQKRVRRDTHDQAIPDMVLKVLETVLHRCPNIEVVIVERLGNTLTTQTEQQEFQSQFQYIHGLVDTLTRRSMDASQSILKERPSYCQQEQDVSIDDISRFQTIVLQALYSSKNVKDATYKIQDQDLNPVLEEYFAQAEPDMLNLAQHLVKKWAVLQP